MLRGMLKNNVARIILFTPIQESEYQWNMFRKQAIKLFTAQVQDCRQTQDLVVSKETFAESRNSWRASRRLTEKKQQSEIIFREVYIFSKNLLVHYSKYCNLIGHATRYLFVNIYWVAVSNAARPSFSQKDNATYCSFIEIILKK